MEPRATGKSGFGPTEAVVRLLDEDRRKEALVWKKLFGGANELNGGDLSLGPADVLYPSHDPPERNSKRDEKRGCGQDHEGPPDGRNG